jgi:hypothetical protein
MPSTYNGTASTTAEAVFKDSKTKGKRSLFRSEYSVILFPQSSNFKNLEKYADALNFFWGLPFKTTMFILPALSDPWFFPPLPDVLLYSQN